MGENNYLAVFARFNNPKWPWTIVVYAPEDDFLGKIKENQQFNLYLSLLIAASACAVGLFLTKSVVRPIKQLRQDANAIKAGQLAIRSPIETVYSELDETVEAFRNMEEELIKEHDANTTLTDSLRKTSVETMRRMATVAEFKDSSTANHIERMSHVCAMLAEELDFKFEGKEITSEQFRSAAAMHDIGKVGVPDHILQKPGKLTGDEWVEMLRHPKHGAEILSGTGSVTIELAREISLTHHEKWDGTGYPYQLRGEEIPMSGQICAISDVFDALIARRCYKAPIPADKALQIIKEGKGTHFAPSVVDAFIKRYDDVLKINRTYPPEE
ncbi:MAG: HD domain-containing protein [Rhodospirillales bacterium]|nr:HD domain-containing protein [Rhodospirillales bacterium]